VGRGRIEATKMALTLEGGGLQAITPGGYARNMEASEAPIQVSRMQNVPVGGVRRESGRLSQVRPRALLREQLGRQQVPTRTVRRQDAGV
jgi:hypothetical protein